MGMYMRTFRGRVVVAMASKPSQKLGMSDGELMAFVASVRKPLKGEGVHAAGIIMFGVG